AAFKLKQLNARFGFLDGARYVLDIGAAPGGWLQVSSEAVGEDGLVVGVDVEKVKPLDLENVKTIVGDVMEEETLERVKKMFAGKIDVILSDLSPRVSGVWEVDHYRQIELSRMAMMISENLLKPDGWFVLKVFQGSEYEGFLNELREAYSYVKVVKPRASRKESAEIYVVARGLKNPSEDE
ncbi:MAG: RlmE family RNA methyltransferase, partial [Candidatus Bathyarchaeota archaeon]|nr:RlmE family RNA methyltransferase [Candidatus Bathyarchaeota archaeon]